jgi:hypothetical protein
MSRSTASVNFPFGRNSTVPGEALTWLLRSRTSSQRRSRRGERPCGLPDVCGDGRPLSGGPARRNLRLSRQSQVRFVTGRSCGASARVCGRGVLSRRGPGPALHHGRATASDRGEDAMPDHRDPPPLAHSRPRDEPCGTSDLGRVPPRPPLPLSGSARRTRSHPDPDRDPRPERAHLGRSSPPGKGTAPTPPSGAPAAVTRNQKPRRHSTSSSIADAGGSRSKREPPGVPGGPMSEVQYGQLAAAPFVRRSRRMSMVRFTRLPNQISPQTPSAT